MTARRPRRWHAGLALQPPRWALPERQLGRAASAWEAGSGSSGMGPPAPSASLLHPSSSSHDAHPPQAPHLRRRRRRWLVQQWQSAFLKRELLPLPSLEKRKPLCFLLYVCIVAQKAYNVTC